MNRPCLTPSCPNVTTRTRCATCERNHQAKRNASPQRAKYQGDWPRIAREAIAEHRATHGDICPGQWCGGPHPIHPNQWVCDHDLGPMCRPGNSRKAAIADRDHQPQPHAT